jgi:hypothetical protein
MNGSTGPQEEKTMTEDTPTQTRLTLGIIGSGYIGSASPGWLPRRDCESS